VLGYEFLNSASFTLIIDGGEGRVIPVPGFYTLTDMIIVAVASSILGVSAIYLLLIESSAQTKLPQINLPEAIIDERKKEWGEIAISLKDDEKKIYEMILDSDGIILQSELTEKTGFSKPKVSRGLETLEIKDLIERKRRGMSNIVILK
jgi:uncharacterized membrane protein